ncbi:MAG TPA: lytic transglycosylase domain-containing protein, partial [Gaiellaceae bacterium]
MSVTALPPAAELPEPSEPPDSWLPAALVRAEQLAAEIVATAQAGARRTLETARTAGASREQDLVGRIETICGAAHDACSQTLAVARSEAAARTASADAKTRQIRAHAQREAARVRADARQTVHELQQRAERRRARLETEFRALVKQRDAAAREFAGAVSSLQVAAGLVTVLREEGGAGVFARRVRPPFRRRFARRAAFVLAPAALVASLGYVLVQSTPAAALFHDDVVATPVAATVRAPLCPVPAAYRTAFVSAATAQHVPLALLVSVATVESRFDANARSTAGAVGLLQLLPSTAGDLQVDPDQPESNILGGATYLHQMLDRFGSTELALAAYNAGPSAVAQGAIPASTLQYVGEVMQNWATIK